MKDFIEPAEPRRDIKWWENYPLHHWWCNDMCPLVPRFDYRKGDEYNPNQWSFQWLILNLWTLDLFQFMVDAEISTHALYVGGIIPYLRFRIGFGDFWMYQWAYKLWRLTRRKPALKNEQGEYN